MRDALPSLFFVRKATATVQAMASVREHAGCKERAERCRDRGAARDCPEAGRRHADRAKRPLRVPCIDTGSRHAD